MNNHKQPYSVLAEAEKVAGRHELKKPEDIDIIDNDWKAASQVTRSLLIQVENITQPLQDAYWQAVRGESWKRALLLYQHLTGTPYLFSINRFTHSEEECQQTEAEYIMKATVWLEEVGELLSG